MDRVYNLHQIDIADNYDGVFMFDRLGKKIQGCRQRIHLAMVFSCKVIDLC
jgi:hypothetical protein